MGTAFKLLEYMFRQETPHDLGEPRKEQRLLNSLAAAMVGLMSRLTVATGIRELYVPCRLGSLTSEKRWLASVELYPVAGAVDARWAALRVAAALCPNVRELLKTGRILGVWPSVPRRKASDARLER